MKSQLPASRFHSALQLIHGITRCAKLFWSARCISGNKVITIKCFWLFFSTTSATSEQKSEKEPNWHFSGECHAFFKCLQCGNVALQVMRSFIARPRPTQRMGADRQVSRLPTKIHQICNIFVDDKICINFLSMRLFEASERIFNVPWKENALCRRAHKY